MQYNSESYMESSAPARDGSSVYPISGTNERIVYVESRKRRRKCCCCFPLIPGVYILIFMYLISGLLTLFGGAFGLKSGDLTALFVILIVYGSIAWLLLPIGLFGLFTRKPKLFMAAPVYLVFSCLSNVGTVIFAFLISYDFTESYEDSKTIEDVDDKERLSTALAQSIGSIFIFNFFFGIYYSYVMIRMYIVMKKGPKT